MHLLLPCSSFSSVKRKCDHVKYDFLQDPSDIMLMGECGE